MASEKPVENKVLAAAQRSCELILGRLSEYLSIRFDHAGRINPHLKEIKQDLMYHELAHVRRTLLTEKIYGPIRVYVADVFLSDEDKRRRGLMSATDQTSLQVELVSHCGAEERHGGETTHGQMRIHDLKGFYAAINPTLSGLMDLLETWVWWDILDAAELVRFEQKLGLISLVRQGRVSEELRKRYTALIRPATTAVEEDEHQAPVTNEEIIRYEIRLAMLIRDQWAYRRQNERGYMYVLKRDELPSPGQSGLIHQLQAKAEEYITIDQMDGIEEEERNRYAGELKLAAEKISQRVILDLLQCQLVEIERAMVRQVDHEAILGTPYNYKERQLEQMDRWLFDLNQQMRGLIKPAEPTAAAVPTPPPTPPPTPSTPPAPAAEAPPKG